MDYNEHYFPVGEARPGRVTHGSLLTCKGCGLQVMLTGKHIRQVHRWWERLGWGKIAVHSRGKAGKGDLYCPACHPTAHAAAVGDEAI